MSQPITFRHALTGVLFDETIRLHASQKIEPFVERLQTAKSQYGDSDPITATRLNDLGEAYQNSGNLPKAIENYHKALKIFLRIHGKFHLDVAFTLNSLGCAELALLEAVYPKSEVVLPEKELPSALPFSSVYEDYNISAELDQEAFNSLDLDPLSVFKHFNHALQICEKLYPNPPTDHRILNNREIVLQNLGILHTELGDYFDATDDLSRCHEIYDKLAQNQDDWLVSWVNKMSTEELEKEETLINFETLIFLLDKALKTCEEHRLPRQAAQSIKNMGLVYQKRGNLSKAHEYFMNARRVYEEFLQGYDDRQLVHACYRGQILLRHNPEGAIDVFKAVLANYETLHYQELHLQKAISLNNLGLALLRASTIEEWLVKMYGGRTSLERLEKERKPIDCFNEALEICKTLYPGPHREKATSLNNLGIAYLREKNDSKASQLFQQAIQVCRELYQVPDGRTITILNSLGAVHLGCKTELQAVPFFEEAFEICQKLYEQPHYQTAST